MPNFLAHLGGDAGVVLRRLLLHVDADQPHRKPALRGQVAVGGEGQVAVAAAQVDDPQRVVGGGRAQLFAERLRDRRVEDPHEFLDLAVLRLPARLDPPLGVGQTERRQHRVVLRQQPLLLAVVRPHGLDRRGPASGVGDGVELLGHPQLVDLGRGLDVPVAERLRQQRIDRGTGRVPDQVVGGEGLGGVVRRDLQVRPRLQVHPPQLGPPPLRLSVGRLLALLPTRRQPAHQRVRVEQVGADPREAVGERLGRGAHFRMAATTTITSSAASATGMTSRRWRGFTQRS